ncbi:MAG: hypothetical protein ABH869_03300 [Candidatus Omnitrophota bacterium]
MLLKIISIVLVISYLFDLTAWAYPEISDLAVQGIIAPMQDREIMHQGFIRYMVSSLSKTPGLGHIYGDVNTKINDRGKTIDVVLEFSRKDEITFSTLVPHSVKEPHYLIPCKLDNKQYYVYISESKDPKVTVLDEKLFKQAQKKGIVEHLKLKNKEKQQILQEQEYDAPLIITYTNKQDIKEVSNQIKQQALDFFIAFGADPDGKLIQEMREFLFSAGKVNLIPQNNTFCLKIGEKDLQIPIEITKAHASNDFINIPTDVYDDITAILIHELSAKCGNPHKEFNEPLERIYHEWKSSKEPLKLGIKYVQFANTIKQMRFKDLKTSENRDKSSLKQKLKQNKKSKSSGSQHKNRDFLGRKVAIRLINKLGVPGIYEITLMDSLPSKERWKEMKIPRKEQYRALIRFLSGNDYEIIKEIIRAELKIKKQEALSRISGPLDIVCFEQNELETIWQIIIRIKGREKPLVYKGHTSRDTRAEKVMQEDAHNQEYFNKISLAHTAKAVFLGLGKTRHETNLTVFIDKWISGGLEARIESDVNGANFVLCKEEDGKENKIKTDDKQSREIAVSIYKTLFLYNEIQPQKVDINRGDFIVVPLWNGKHKVVIKNTRIAREEPCLFFNEKDHAVELDTKEFFVFLDGMLAFGVKDKGFIRVADFSAVLEGMYEGIVARFYAGARKVGFSLARIKGITDNLLLVLLDNYMTRMDTQQIENTYITNNKKEIKKAIQKYLFDLCIHVLNREIYGFSEQGPCLFVDPKTHIVRELEASVDLEKMTEHKALNQALEKIVFQEDDIDIVEHLSQEKTEYLIGNMQKLEAFQEKAKDGLQIHIVKDEAILEELTEKGYANIAKGLITPDFIYTLHFSKIRLSGRGY